MVDYVILGGPPFETTANQTSLQTFSELGANSKTLYVCRRYQGSGLRNLLGTGLKKKRSRLKIGITRIDENRYVLALPALSEFLPMVAPELFRRLQLQLVTRAVKDALGKLEMVSPTLITYWWMFPEIVAWSAWSRRVFDLIDRHWGYEYLGRRGETSRNLELALQTARRSNKTVAVSKALKSELGSHGVDAEVVENAIDLKRVDLALANAPKESRQKRAVYCGGWNSRLDESLLSHLIQRNRDWHFTFVGAGAQPGFETAPNVTFLGNVDYDAALIEISSAAIGLVPFQSNDFTESSNFLKVLDYLACGAHVGATRLASLGATEASYLDRVTLCDSLGDWDALFDEATIRGLHGENYTQPEALSRNSVSRRVSDLLRES